MTVTRRRPARAEDRPPPTLAAIAAAIAQASDLDAALARALDLTVDALGLKAAALFDVPSPPGPLAATPHRRGRPGHAAAALADDPRVGQALASLSPVASGPQAFVPLYARGRAVGLLVAVRPPRRVFEAHELELLAAVGGVLGSAIENARLVRGSERHLAQVQALWGIDKALVEDGDLTAVLGAIAREASRLVDGEAVIVLVEGDEDLRVAGAAGRRALELLGDPPALAGTPLADYLASAAPTAVALRGRRGQAVVVPLRAGERMLGGLVVLHHVAGWTEEDLTTLATFGRRAAMALARADARQAEERRTGQLALLAGASEIAASTLDVKALLGAIARYVQRAFGYYSVAVYLVDEESRAATLAGAAGAAATLMPREHRLAFGAGIIAWVAERGQPLLANDVRREPRFVAGQLHGTLSELAVPVRVGGAVVAVVNVESDRVDAFDEGDVVALDGIASQVASAIQNARLFEDRVAAVRNLEILQEVTNVLNSELELDVLLQRIAERSVEAVRAAERGAVLLDDGSALVVRSRHGYAESARLADVRLAREEGLTGRVFATGQGRLAGPGEGPLTHPAFADAGGATTHSALCVPISLPRARLGVLLLESTATTQAFEPADLRFAAALADHAAIAIGNALHLRRILDMDRHRQEYLSNVSHELRTPLTVVQGYIEAAAARVATDEKAAGYLAIAYDHCLRLGRMIEEVLHVSRLERGVAVRDLERAPVSLADTVGSVLESLAAEAATRGIEIAADVPAGGSIAGDPRLLQSLVFHVVENAVKFTNPGGHVKVALVPKGGEVRLRVEDDGIGIATEFHDLIFEKFFMVDSGLAKARGGAGIGLYVAREAARLHGGTITVKSVPGRGSTFEVRLPANTADPPPASGLVASRPSKLL